MLHELNIKEKQAEVQNRIIVNEQLATKHDLKELENDLILRFGGMLTVAVGVIAMLNKLM